MLPHTPSSGGCWPGRVLEWTHKDLATMPAGDDAPWAWDTGLQGTVYASSHYPGRWNSQIQELKVGSGPLTIIPSDLLGEVVLPVSATLVSPRLKTPVPEVNGGERNFCTNLDRASLNLKLCLSPGHLKLLGQQSSKPKKKKKGVFILAGIIDLDYHKEAGFFLHSGNRKKCVWNSKDSLGPLLMPLDCGWAIAATTPLTRTWKPGVQTPQGCGCSLSHWAHNLDQQKDWPRVRGIQSEG